MVQKSVAEPEPRFWGLWAAGKETLSPAPALELCTAHTTISPVATEPSVECSAPFFVVFTPLTELLGQVCMHYCAKLGGGRNVAVMPCDAFHLTQQLVRGIATSINPPYLTASPFPDSSFTPM